MEQIGAFLPLILIFGVFYILLIRPQQKKIKQHREMINNLRRGDKIISTGGIICTITKVSDNKEMFVEISEGVEVKLAPGMVTDIYNFSEKTNKQNNINSEKKEVTQSGGNLISNLFKKKDK